MGITLVPYVESYLDISKFPPTGNLDTIYIDRSNNALYIWNGSSYELAGSSIIDGQVDFYADLPNASSHNGEIWLVTTATGSPGDPGYKPAGFYVSNGLVWTFIGAGGAIESIQGTANQILVNGTSGTPQIGNITLTIPPSPIFVGLTLSGLGNGVLKSTAGVVSANATTSDLPEGSNLYFTAARVLGTILTGLTLLNSNAIATDSLLIASGKFQGQINNIRSLNTEDVTLSGQGYITLTPGTQNLVIGAVDLSGANATGILAAARFPALTGDITTPSGSIATTISAGVVTYAKIQNISTNNRLLGRSTAGAGNVEEITISTGLSLSAGILTVTGAPPTGAAGGDLSVTYPNPTVAKINGHSLGSTVQANGNILASDGTNWISQSVKGDITATSVTGFISTIVNAINGVPLGSTTSTSGNILIGQGAVSGWVTQSVSGDATLANTGALTLAANSVSNAKFRQSVALSVVGNSTNSTANVADIAAASDNQVLRRSGTSIGFGALNLASGNAVTGLLPATNGGSGFGTYTLGDMLYASGTSALSLVPGTTSTSTRYLSQTGNGTISAAPAWVNIGGSDITGAALTKTDDTNVTLTLGGTPTTALLRAASLALGWTGQLSIARGGSNASSQSTNGVNYFDGTKITSASGFTYAGGSAGLVTVGGGGMIVGTSAAGAGGNLRLNDNDTYLRSGSDTNHGLGWYDPTTKTWTNFTNDGPILYGFNGGALGTTAGSKDVIWNWDTNGDVAAKKGNILINIAGKTLKIKQGTNAASGTGATMVAGAVTVNTTVVATGDTVLVSRTATGGTVGINMPIASIVNGTSFTLTSSNVLDTSTYSWIIIKPS